MTAKILIPLAIFSNVMASILLKFASAYIPEKISLINLKGVFYAGGAISFYVISFLLYAIILKGMPVSKAYLFTTFGTQVSLLIVGVFLFSESYDFMAWVGIFLILFGAIFVGFSGGER